MSSVGLGVGVVEGVVVGEPTSISMLNPCGSVFVGESIGSNEGNLLEV